MAQSHKKNVEVYFRIFPMNNTQWDLINIENTTLYMRSIQDLSKSHQDHSKYWEFKSDEIFINNSQEYIYTSVTKGLLESIIKGYNGIIMGLGQTGTGKSFTLGGLQMTEKELGIGPRLIFDLFKIKKQFPKNIKMSIQISYTEFSNSNVVDLLKDFPNSINQWHVKNATKIIVTDEYDALKLLFAGEGRKTFANNDAYMSHICSSVLTLHISTANQDFTFPKKISSRLHIIDMAGLDSVGNMSSHFKTSLDIGKANIIKSYMEQFMLSLKQHVPKNIHVKERTNPLIYFLGNDLSNESILRFIGHIRLQKSDMKITLSTLRFGQSMGGLKPKMKKIEPKLNEEVQLQYLQNKLENLQKEKIYYSVLMNQDLTTDLSEHRMQHIQRTVDAYIQNRITELNILNVAEAAEAFKIFKSVCNSFEEERSKTQDNDHTKLKRNSKTGSRISLKNIKSVNKKIKRSRGDSISTLDKAKLKPDSSGASLRAKSVLIQQSTSKQLTVTSSVSQSRVKRPRSNSTVGKQSSVIITRKSTASSLKDKRESKAHLIDTALIPDILPKYTKAWISFTNDAKSSYKIHHASHKANENELKKVYLDYQKEVRTLQLCKGIVERRKNELMEVKMFQNFIAPYECPDVTTDSERICRENLDIAQDELLGQQEVVLKLQSELKLCLNNRSEIRQRLKEDFDQYCKDNFNVVVPSLDEQEEDEVVMKEERLNMETKSVEDLEEEELKCIDKFIDAVTLDKLKKIMERELRKNMKQRELKNRKWKNLC